MTRRSILAQSARHPSKPDAIYAASAKAKEDIAILGKESVINATLGECLDDDGNMMILPSTEELVRTLPMEEFSAYAPITGVPHFGEAVQISLFSHRLADFTVECTPTPGAAGAIRHAVCGFLDPGESLLTTDWIWGPYRTICEEQGRKMKTFPLFNSDCTFHTEAYKEAVQYLCAEQDNILIILNTPAQNPTGYTMTERELNEVYDITKKAAEQFPEKNISLCFDLSYIDFAPDKSITLDAIESSGEKLAPNENLLLTFGMSKSYTLCGQRLGALCLLGQDAESAEEFRASMSFASRGTWSNAPRLPQTILTTICLDPVRKAKADAERQEIAEKMYAKGKTFTEEADRIGLPTLPWKSGYFVAIPCSDPKRLADALSKKHVYVVPQTKGIRFSPCAVTLKQNKAAPSIIFETLKETGF